MSFPQDPSPDLSNPFTCLYLLSRPVPEKRVHIGVAPEISLIVRVTHALLHGSHQATVLIPVLP